MPDAMRIRTGAWCVDGTRSTQDERGPDSVGSRVRMKSTSV